MTKNLTKDTSANSTEPAPQHQAFGHRLRTPEVEALLQALDALRGTDELYTFLLDAATPRELTEIAQRLEVARLLADGIAYATIQAQTGASATTIARVSKCLQYGEGGYARALQRLERLTQLAPASENGKE